MNQRELPPLALLPAFEAAGRLGTFKDAANELHITPSAISQQIKALEDALGVALFVRHGRTVVLSQEGEEYLRDVRQLLADLGSATRRLRRRGETNTLRISTIDFVAYEFLIPRLAAFRARFPGIELRIESSSKLIDFESSEFDAALRLGGTLISGLAVTQLGPLFATPVCTAAIARELGDGELEFEHPLIELRGQEHRGWHALMKSRGVKKRPQVTTLETYYESVRAAEQGLGVAFGVFPITTHWVTGARLAVPHSIRMPMPGGAMWMYRASDPRPVLAAIGEWLREQYEMLPELPSGRIVHDPSRRATPKRTAVQSAPRPKKRS